jgi:tetratricopeptide (TPR) repeat protein
LPLAPGAENGHIADVARIFETGGMPEEALNTWRSYRSYYRKVPRPSEPDIAKKWDGELARILIEELTTRLAQYGRMDEAIATCRAALELVPQSVPARFQLGLLLFNGRGELEESLGLFRAVLDDPDLGGMAALRAATILSAHPDPQRRDPSEAIRLATRACAGGGAQDPMALDALAMAHASAGNFGSAVQTATRALEIARRAGQKPAIGPIQQRLGLYQRGQPYQLGSGR